MKITKDGFKYFKWDPEAKADKEISVKSFLPYLRNGCEVESGVTLADIFRAVEGDELLSAFLSLYSSCNMEAFHKEAQKRGGKTSDLDYLEICAFFEYGEGLDVQFGGVKGTTEYGISFLPMNEIAPLEVRVREECKVLRDFEEIGKTKVDLSLLQVLDAIYFEISFYGGPEGREEVSQQLHKSLKEIEEGTAVLHPFLLENPSCPECGVETKPWRRSFACPNCRTSISGTRLTAEEAKEIGKV